MWGGAGRGTGGCKASGETEGKTEGGAGAAKMTEMTDEDDSCDLCV